MWYPDQRTRLVPARLSAQSVVLADTESGPVGFLGLTPEGYLDLAFILAPWRRRGLFARLASAVEDIARRQGNTRIETHASLAAIPAFARHGYQIAQREHVTRGDQRLQRALMVKHPL